MKKQFWTVIDPEGDVWMRSYWKTRSGANGAWDFLKYSEGASVKNLIAIGFRVVKCWVEIEEEV